MTRAIFKHKGGVSINKKIIAVFSIAFSICFYFSICLLPSAKQQEDCLTNSLLDIPCAITAVVVMIGVFLLLNFVISKLESKTILTVPGNGIITSAPRFDGKKAFLISFIINFISFFVAFMTYFPGTGMNDTINGIMSATGSADMQPIIFQTYVWLFTKIFSKLLGSYVAAYALMVLIQMVFCAAVIAYTFSWLIKRGFLQFHPMLYLLYFPCIPIFADYSITIVKDTVFSFFVLLLLPCLYDILYEKEDSCKRWWLFVFSCVGVWFTRSDGKIVVLGLCVMLLFKVSQVRKKILILSVGLLLLNTGINFARNCINPSTVSFRESVGIPLNQISAVVSAGGNLDEDDIAFIEELLPLENWAEDYSFSFVDAVKFDGSFNNDFLNENKKQFMKTWFHIVQNNLGICIKSYLYQTYGVWNICYASPVDVSQSIFTKINNNTSIDSSWGRFLEEIKLENREILPYWLQTCLKEIYEDLLEIAVHITSGMYFWTLLSCLLCVLCIRKKYSKMFLVLIFPDILIWLMKMIAVPVSFVYRYHIYLAITIPFIISLTAGSIKDEREL